jgi:hypothetical protein
MWFGGNDLDPWLVLFEAPAGTGQRATGAQAGHEMGDRGQVAQDLGCRRSVVDARIGGIAVLIRHVKTVRMRIEQLPGAFDRAVGAKLAWREVERRAVQREELTALDADVLGQDRQKFVAAPARQHGQSDAGVAACRLDDHPIRARLQIAAGLGRVEHGQRHAVLDRTGWVGAFELGPDADTRPRTEAGQLDQRRIADGAFYGREAVGCRQSHRRGSSPVSGRQRRPAESRSRRGRSPASRDP